MPYKKISDLPEKIRLHLPKHAQEIYKEAFNHAYSEYETRNDQEVISHKVAWAAVKKVYKKTEDGQWVKI